MRKFVSPRAGPVATRSVGRVSSLGSWLEGLEARRLLAATPFEPYTGNLRFGPTLRATPEMRIPFVGPVQLSAQPSAAATAETAAALAVTAAPAPGGALAGKVLYMHGGHGYVWRGGSTWGVMRGYVNGMMEDHGNVDQLNFFAEHALAAGATVVPLRPVGHQLNEVIVDNAGPGFTTTGTWSTSASGPYWSNNNGNDGGNNYRFATTTTGIETAVARFTPTIAETGFYPVYAWANPGATDNRVEDQIYRINYAGGSKEVKVATRLVGNGWIYLGNHYFTAGTGGNVEVSNKSATGGKSVIADAIRFGNGMGDYDPDDTGTAPISGQPREEECALYWIYQQRGWTAPGTRVSLNEAGGTSNPNHEERNFSAMALWSEYMNNGAFGDREDRVFLSFHSDASSNLAARGTTALITSNPTLNQTRLAQIAGGTVETEMRMLDATHEHPWASRSDTLTGTYGEISNGNFGGEMDATIIEVAFHTNAMDADLMKDPVVRNDLGRSTTHVAIKYFSEFGEAPQITTYTPEPPRNVRATTTAAGQVTLAWAAGPSSTGTAGPYGNAPTGYRVWTSENGYGFELAATVAGNATSYTLDGLPADRMTYFMVTAVNAGGESLKSSTVGAKLQDGRRAPVLIVNNYSRLDRQGDDVESEYFGTVPRVRLRHNNTLDYVVQAGEAIESHNSALGVESATDEAVARGQINLSNYHTVIWMAGEQSTADETFDSTTQPLVSSFLAGGGKLFVSGSEIGWDLVGQANETPDDAAFYQNTLRTTYVRDDAGVYATGSGLAGTALAGVGALNFDNGTHGTYDVDFPDVLAAGAGATVAMNYSNGSGNGAVVQWGPAGQPARLINMGFPFETIYQPSQRNALMGAVLNYFGTTSTIFSPAPGIPDLVATSDTGSSNGDNITNRDNSSGSKTLEFLVTGTVAGAAVNLYADGVLIGTASGSDGTTTVTTNGVVDLADGARSITARQQETGRSLSPASAPLGVIIDATPPAVTNVFVSGTAWTASFKNFLATSGQGDAAFGYHLNAAEQTDELSWVNLNRISIRFNENVNVAADDLVVRGVNNAVYPISATGGFVYDAATLTATWTLAKTIPHEKILLDLDADFVTDVSGNALDGDWTNPVSPAISGDTFPSGDGSAGGDFHFRLNVLPGDVNRSGGSVVGSDVTLTRNAQNSPPGGANSLYTIFKDVNGSASILGSDVTLVRNRQGTRLPLDEPVAPLAGDESDEEEELLLP